MLIVELTESSARFITGLIAFLIVMAFFGWLSEATGVHPFILMGIGVLIFIGFVISILKSARGPSNFHSESRCYFNRANGSQCVKAKIDDSDYCEYHAKKMNIAEPVSNSASRPKRSQCGFLRDDGSKCKKLKPVDVRRCDYHLKLENSAGN